jgi:hypothetical protein
MNSLRTEDSTADCLATHILNFRAASGKVLWTLAPVPWKQADPPGTNGPDGSAWVLPAVVLSL